MNVRWIVVTLLVLGAAVTGLLLWQKRPAAVQAKVAEERSGYVLHDFELIALDENGKESFAVHAPHLQETPGARTLELKEPLFLLPSTDVPGEHWELRARSGWVSDDQEEVRLRGEVVGTSPEGGTRQLTMNTGRLNVYPRQRRASSDDVVTLVQPGSTMTGRGMEALLSENRVTLQSEVKGRYVPSR
ncbi:MAG: LPS export ABC transporter periplasmic protein LptC [Pseudoxanthomonas suwonensis]|nr:LPS export ABC transporter periplasmic protein LptC [Pseudoxanthomonas suwonensis]